MFEFEDRITVKDREQRECKVATYEQQLRDNPDVAAGYLKGRGITGQLAKSFRLGYVQEPLLGDDSHRGRLVIPYLTRAGVTWIKTRALPGSAQPDVRYTWITAGSGSRFYNTRDMLTPADRLALCEGELDAAVLSFLCGIPAVGLPGASNWRKEYRTLFADYDTVYVVADGDEAGRKCSQQVKGDLKSKARVVDLPDGEDVNSFYCKHGREAMRELIGVK